MPLNKEIARSLAYLRKKYKVSDPDLLAIGKKLSQEQETEESWEEIVQKSLEMRKKRAINRKR